jgi:long-chain-fatty-acid--[acyl-carrier-protein] ligase
MTIAQAVLHQAKRRLGAVIVADQIAGALTWRDVILAVIVLRKHVAALPGENVGIMMPASAAAGIIYLATVFAGKTPVMVNWTLGRRHLRHCLDTLNVERVLTAEQLVKQLEAQNIDLADIESRLICLEDIRARLGRWEKLAGWVRSRCSWSVLRKAEIAPTAVVLFTSGSEDVPKAVPLTHRNILTNIADAYRCFTITSKDSILGMLPPFHAFGLTVSVLLPMSLGIRSVYYPNPTDGRTLGQMIDAYKVSILVGTPTFLNGIIRTSSTGQLASLRLVVSGAEKCPARVYEALARRCPQTAVLEGYGVTECSPVVSVNHQDDPHAGTIGKVMSSLEYALVDEGMQKLVETGQRGMLLVRGPSVFEGYLRYDGPSPFVTFENKSWYRTGDLVCEDENQVLTFSGRLKRFVKIGGEMISLPAIEAVLEPHYAGAQDEGPMLAVLAAHVADHPEIVLFAARPLERGEVNEHISKAGLSGLHRIRRVIHVDELPLLGTGKTDYRALSRKLQEMPA